MKDRLLSGAFAAGWALVCRIPESWARWLFAFGAEIAWRRQGKGVQVLEGNLLRVLGPDADGAALRAMSRKVLRSYARYYLEAFRLQVIGPERIVAGMHNDSPNVALTMEYLRNGRGVVYALPHCGQFEAAGVWIIAKGAGQFTTVAERLKPEAVFQRFLRFREALGMEVLPTTGGPNPSGVMAQRLRSGRLVCLVADRDLSDTAVEVDFFGEKALMPAGPAALAVQTGAALMPVSCWFAGQDEWGTYVHDEIPVPAEGDRRAKVAAMTQQLATVFEKGIREHPEDWHMLQRVFVADLDPGRLPPGGLRPSRDPRPERAGRQPPGDAASGQ
jgi:phosphatidylinositol dimannoside acyltransferase